VTAVARGDYAINGGASNVSSFSGPIDLSQGDDGQFWQNAGVPARFTGISHLRAATALKSVVDGASKTYLAGEKYVDNGSYTNGESLGDNESLYAGYCTDLHRFTGAVESVKFSLPPFAEPLGDFGATTGGIPGATRFGSAHPAGFNMAFCDGAALFLSFEIDPEVHLRSGHTRDEGRVLASL
jgi:prepilin-type processing-associated H-X9-DG protein